jgi:hypothetical protein
VTISEIRAIEGSAGHWLVRGRVLIRKTGDRQNSSDASQIGDAAWRRQYNDNSSRYFEDQRERNGNARREEARARDHSETPSYEPGHQNDTKKPTHDDHEDTAHRRDQSSQIITPYFRDQDRTDYTYTYATELKEFDGTYSSEDAQPTIDITVR